MIKNTLPKLTGAALAMAVAGLAATSGAIASDKKSDKVEMAHCYGVNACKGHNDCTTAENGCAGSGSCKGHGYLVIPTKACGDIGGTLKDETRVEGNKADMSKCMAANACKGHNDCKTADNACAGKASCKGHGYVMMPAKACADIGAKTGS